MRSQIDTTCDTSCNAAAGLYAGVLGARWHELNPALRRFHAGGQAVHATGVFQVRHGTNWLARLATRLARLPGEGNAIPVRLTVSPHGDGEKWNRTFSTQPLLSYQTRHADGVLGEVMGLMETRLRLEVVDGALIYHPAGSVFRLGPVRIWLPGWLAPVVSAWERPIVGSNDTQVSVEVTSPLLGLLVAYAGTVTIVEEQV
ncbi:MAG: hypothetical protein JWN34_3935 [Bryobacterales bacterium]|nr:hypothetical protein [Bryobacterales bacterium]